REGDEAACLLEAAEADIVWAEGRFGVVGTDRAVTIRDVARTAFQVARLPPGLEPGLYETGTFSPGPAESGQLLTGSFMDYGIPRADTLCDIAVERPQDLMADPPLTTAVPAAPSRRPRPASWS
ncbi:MAG: hypothetical protein ACRDHK_11500, partial [Actinomycetota bacterium]